MSNSMGEDELLGSGTEEAIYKKGFQQGYDEGSQEGGVEGWSAGLQTGADIGFELGKYKGFALAAREHLQTSGGDESKPSKTIKLCEKVIKLVDEFNWDNVTSVHDASSQVRTQFNLLRAQLGIVDEGSTEGIPGQKFSF